MHVTLYFLNKNYFHNKSDTVKSNHLILLLIQRSDVTSVEVYAFGLFSLKTIIQKENEYGQGNY